MAGTHTRNGEICSLCDVQNQGGTKCLPSGTLRVGEIRIDVSTGKTKLLLHIFPRSYTGKIYI